MFFKFINYISPSWYFNLEPLRSDIPYLVDYNLLNEDEKAIITFDKGYSSNDVSMLDAAYQAWHKGIIKTEVRFSLQPSVNKPELYDEYYFIRKYHKPFWAFCILILRVVTFHNPFREIGAFSKARKSKRKNLYDSLYPNKDYETFQSGLLQAAPLTSIIIPTLNRYRYLHDVLTDLEKQDYKNFEVIVIDQSVPFDSGFYQNYKLDLQVLPQTEKALWLARNAGIKISKGGYLLFYDDDSRVEKDWITQHMKTMDFFNADISSGVSLSPGDSIVPVSYRILKWADQVDTGNFLIKKEVFKTTGLFDRQFERQRMGDGEFGLRCYLNGFKNISNPFAKRIHLKVSEGGLRQVGSWDGFRPKKLLAPRPIPSVNYYLRKYFGNANAIYSLLINIPPSLMPYRFKRSKPMMILGSIIFIILLPLMIIPLIISWFISGRMMREGAKIEPI